MYKNQKVFASLQQKFTEIIYSVFDKQIDEIAIIQNKNKKILLDEIARILLNYPIGEEVMKLKNTDRLKLISKFEKLINKVFVNEKDFEIDFIEKMHTDIIKEKYYTNSYIFSIGIDYKLKPVKQNVLDKIINKKIDGKTYSDRIWDNKNKVAKQMKAEVNNFLNGKTSVNEINSVIGKQFNVNWNNSNRLTRDSIARVQEDANKVWRNYHNIKNVLWDATLDLKTCSDCASMDGKVFEVGKEPKIPRHIMCRCTYISLVDKNWRPKQKLDNITKERIDYTTYKEWLGNQKIKY